MEGAGIFGYSATLTSQIYNAFVAQESVVHAPAVLAFRIIPPHVAVVEFFGSLLPPVTEPFIQGSVPATNDIAKGLP